MCHSDDSRPPAPPVVGAVAEHGPVELTAADGNRFAAYRAAPAEPNGGNVILLPDVRGLHPFYRDLARRFAEAGFRTVAMDYFGRSAGIGDRDDSFDSEKHLARLEAAHIEADAAAVAALLRAENPGPVFTVGFCYGGAKSWQLATAGLDLAGAIGFYGPPRMVDGATADMAAPLLLLLAGDDVVTTREAFGEFTEGLDRAGKEYEAHVYDGAPHSFFDRSFDAWQDACADAWRRVLDFTERHAGSPA